MKRLPGTVAEEIICSAAIEVSVSSMKSTGRLYRVFNLAAKFLAARASSVSLSIEVSGIPTTRPSGRHSSINALISVQGPSFPELLTVPIAWAVPVTSCPVATPMRFVPKSNPINVRLMRDPSVTIDVRD